jgi:hypothetical protein
MIDRRKLPCCAVAIGLLWTIHAVHAAELDAFAQWTPLDEAALERLRGGFTTHDGLHIALGLERIVLLDGAVEARAAFHIPDLRLGQVERERLAGLVVSNGFSDGVTGMHPGITTLIQNTLDNRTIQNLTIWNVDVANLGQLYSGGLRLSDSLIGGIAR